MGAYSEKDDPSYQLHGISNRVDTCSSPFKRPYDPSMMERFPACPLVSDFEAILPYLWRAESSLLYRREVLLESLVSFLEACCPRESGAILDVSGGIGFPFIDLLKRGWPIHYNDGSPAMTSWVSRRVPKKVFRERCSNLRWEDFTEENKYSFLLCMGNSLPHAAGWGGRRVDRN